MDVMTGVLFVIGIGLLIGGAEALVRGASRLAMGLGIAPLVVGLTVVAFGTSAPELAVTLQSVGSGPEGAQIAIGNVVGSNIANILLILGLSATLTPLVVHRQLVRLDVPIMIGAALLMLLLALDGQIGRYDGLLLFGGAVAYTTFTIRQSRRERPMTPSEEDSAAPQLRRPLDWLVNLGLVVGGLVLLVLGARWLVDGAIMVARALGVSELVIGLTVVAVGTSLPEIATSVIAALRGTRDIAVGNAVGSNIFNVLCVLGLAAVFAPSGILVSPAALSFDIPVMIAVVFACLPIFFNGWRIARWEGLLFLAYYAAYTAYLVLSATNHAALPVFSSVMLLYVLPLTVVTILVVTVRFFRAERRPNAQPGEVA